MAFDFPSSPTLNQQFTPVAGTTYVWNGYAWIIPAGVVATAIADAPPGSPTAGQLWWESDTGTLWIYYNDGNTSQWVAVGGGTNIIAIAGPPQGRLTLQSATPVMTTTQGGKTTIFYTPYVGNLVPIYNGTSFVMASFAELSALTTDATKSPAAIGVNKVNDWFIWSDAGTLRLSHGPDWASDTTRNLLLVRLNGTWLNNVDITNGPASQRGTYIGTTRSDASSQLNWNFGVAAVGGGAGNFSVWNTYNRRPVVSMTLDTTPTYQYGAAAWRPPNGSVNMRTYFVVGLQEDAFTADHTLTARHDAADIAAGIGFDSTTASIGTAGYAYAAGAVASNVNARAGVIPAPGFHYLTALEYTITPTSTIYGTGGQPCIQSGLVTRLEM